MVIKHIYKNDNKPAITVRRENALANFVIDWRLMNIYVWIHASGFEMTDFKLIRLQNSDEDERNLNMFT